MKGDDCISEVCNQIIHDFSPQQVILFNVKHSVTGDVKSFKICIVADTPDKGETEKKIYLGVDSRLPFDIVLYTPEEWAKLLGENGSFASVIEKEGMFVYGAGETQGGQQ